MTRQGVFFVCVVSVGPIVETVGPIVETVGSIVETVGSRVRFIGPTEKTDEPTIQPRCGVRPLAGEKKQIRA